MHTFWRIGALLPSGPFGDGGSAADIAGTISTVQRVAKAFENVAG